MRTNNLRIFYVLLQDRRFENYKIQSYGSKDIVF
jgi:hypothetical protein